MCNLVWQLCRGQRILEGSDEKYEHIIDGYGIDEWGATDQGFNGQELMEALNAIQNIPIRRGCRKGGGNLSCKIRPCTSNKKLVDCTECKKFMKCENREPLQKVRTGAFNVGMTIKTREDKASQQELVEKWALQLRNKWLFSTLFEEDK